jgi:hypothetical protein
MATQNEAIVISDSDDELSDTPCPLTKVTDLCAPPPLEQPGAIKSEEPPDESPSQSFQNPTNQEPYEPDEPVAQPAEPVAQPNERHHPSDQEPVAHTNLVQDVTQQEPLAPSDEFQNPTDQTPVAQAAQSELPPGLRVWIKFGKRAGWEAVVADLCDAGHTVGETREDGKDVLLFFPTVRTNFREKAVASSREYVAYGCECSLSFYSHGVRKFHGGVALTSYCGIFHLLVQAVNLKTFKGDDKTYYKSLFKWYKRENVCLSPKAINRAKKCIPAGTNTDPKKFWLQNLAGRL